MASSPDLDAIARDFERDGFASGGVVLEGGEVEALHRDLQRLAGPIVGVSGSRFEVYAADLSDSAGQSHHQLTCVWHGSDLFRRLIEDPRITTIAAHLTHSRTLQLWVDNLHWKPPRKGARFAWHQDAPYHFSLEPREVLLGVWVALDDADEESGCMWMVPGSHRWGVHEGYLWNFKSATEPEDFRAITPGADMPQPNAEWRPPVPRIARAGEVLFHHSLVWHGSSANRSDRHRRGYSMFLMPEGVRASARPDQRIPVPPGTPMVDAGPNFPIVYREERAG